MRRRYLAPAVALCLAAVQAAAGLPLWGPAPAGEACQGCSSGFCGREASETFCPISCRGRCRSRDASRSDALTSRCGCGDHGAEGIHSDREPASLPPRPGLDAPHPTLRTIDSIFPAPPLLSRAPDVPPPRRLGVRAQS